MNGARYVGGAVAVLAARVAQVHLVVRDRPVGRLGRLVVDDGAVRPGR